MKRWNLIFILSIFLACGFVGDALAVIYYVNDATGLNGAGQGLKADKPFKTIQYALGKSNATEIRIAKGTYTGPFSIPEFRKITLKGAGVEKTILNGDSTNPVVSADGPTKLTLTALTIQNGTNGIWGRMAYLTCTKILVRDNTSHGIYAKGNSYLSLSDSTVSSNGGHGVRVKESSSGDILRSTLTSNTYSGINVAYGSYGYIEACTVSQNTQSGVQVNGSSTAYFLNNQLFSNQYAGADINSNSNANFGGGNKIYDNANNSGWRSGVGVFQASSAIFISEAADNPEQIYENKGPGIYVSGTSELLLQTASVHNNSGNGVSIVQGSSGSIAGAEIFGNTANGVGVWNSTLYLNSGSVHNNSANGVILSNVSTGQFNTSANIDNNSLLGINCGGNTGVAFGDAGSVSGNGSGQTNCQGWTP
jgi:parallel beta-helix repeat protein